MTHFFFNLISIRKSNQNIRSITYFNFIWLLKIFTLRPPVLLYGTGAWVLGKFIWEYAVAKIFTDLSMNKFPFLHKNLYEFEFVVDIADVLCEQSRCALRKRRMLRKNSKINGDFFSAKKMSPCYKVHKNNCWPALL